MITLTSREKQILRLLAEGYTHKEIADKLDKTVPALRFEMRILRAKLGAENSTQAVATAIREGHINA